MILPVETQTESVQYAWSQEIGTNETDLDSYEYEKLIELVFNEIKREYKDDETCRTNSLLLGKLLVLANQWTLMNCNPILHNKSKRIEIKLKDCPH